MSAAIPIDSTEAFRFPSIRVQSIIVSLPLESVERALTYLDNAARNAQRAGAAPRVTVAYGDCSPRPCIPDEARAEFRRRFVQLSEIEYTFFDANLGRAPAAISS